MTGIAFTDVLPVVLCMVGVLALVAAIHIGSKVYRQYRSSDDGQTGTNLSRSWVVVVGVLIVAAVALLALGVPGLVRFIQSGPPLLG